MQSQLTAQKKEIATLQSDRQKTANEIGTLQTKLKLKSENFKYVPQLLNQLKDLELLNTNYIFFHNTILCLFFFYSIVNTFILNT